MCLDHRSVWLKKKLLKLLKLLTDGDVESNSGPTFKILKVIQGYFHQGHPKFGHTAAYNVPVTPYMHYTGLLLNVSQCGQRQI